MKIRDKFTCPLELVHDMIKGKWKPIIIWRLRYGNTSFSKLHSDIEGITEKMLVEQVKELIEFEFVDKKTYDGYPLRVEYFLTKSGEKMVEALGIMQSIGIDYFRANGKADILIEMGIITE